MTKKNTNPKKILLIYYSFSGQARSLLRSFENILTENGLHVVCERLEPVPALRFPLSGFGPCIKMMIATFFRQRIPIADISPACKDDYDLIILAGPTWSYNPSGPILSLIDRYGSQIFKGKSVLPLISCRGYWRFHWYGLKSLLEKCGAKIPNVIVFSHPNKEPWRTIGVFLKIAGKTPERSALLMNHYQKFGHSKEQQSEAERFALMLAEALINDTPISQLQFQTKEALP